MTTQILLQTKAAVFSEILASAVRVMVIIRIHAIAKQIVFVPVVGAIPHAPGLVVRQETCAASIIHCGSAGV